MVGIHYRIHQLDGAIYGHKAREFVARENFHEANGDFYDLIIDEMGETI